MLRQCLSKLEFSSQEARNLVETAAARAAADAGIQRALIDLDAHKIAGQAQYSWRLGDTSIVISIKDEAAKLNLNTASPSEIIEVLRSVGVGAEKAAQLADAIADFIDPDDFRRANGAEKQDYQSLGLYWGPKNGPLEVVEELQQVLGMTPAIYRKVAPLVTTYLVTPIPAETPSGFITISQAVNVGGVTFSIRSEARRASGIRFVREVIAEPNQGRNPWILSWQRAY